MGENPNNNSSSEKRRRNEMNSLYNQLFSLVPHQPSREIVCVAEEVESATKYIKQLQTNLEILKKKKEMVMLENMKVPARIDLDFCNSSLKVVLISDCRLKNGFMLTHILRILHEEAGADVVSAAVSVVDQSVFHTLHSKIGEYDDAAAARISERLRKLVHD